MNSEARRFYEEFAKRLILDFVRGNPRTEAAIRHAMRWAARCQASAAIDIGCGIGWSSNELARSNPGMKILGVDMSLSSITIAQSLFPRDNLSFLQADANDAGFWEQCKDIGMVALLDVYEHIPARERASFHARVSAICSDAATIAITCPSIRHQEYLRKESPSSLQPVDEDVSVSDLLRFAEDAGGELVMFEYQSIWHTDDYFHAVIRRGGDFRAVDRARRAWSDELEPARARAERVRMHGELAELIDPMVWQEILDAGSGLFGRVSRALRIRTRLRAFLKG